MRTNNLSLCTRALRCALFAVFGCGGGVRGCRRVVLRYREGGFSVTGGRISCYGRAVFCLERQKILSPVTGISLPRNRKSALPCAIVLCRLRRDVGLEMDEKSGALVWKWLRFFRILVWKCTRNWVLLVWKWSRFSRFLVWKWMKNRVFLVWKWLLICIFVSDNKQITYV